MTDPWTEKPETKDTQDHTFGKTIAEKTARAEQGAEDGAPPEDGSTIEHHAGGKA